MCSKKCCNLKPEWRRVLDEIAARHRTGREATIDDFNLRVLKALMRRHYIEERMEIRRSPLGHDYAEWLYRPTVKALSLFREEAARAQVAEEIAHARADEEAK